MDKHSITLPNALAYTKKIIEASQFGIRGKAEILGKMVMARYQHGPVEVSLYVTFAPEMEAQMEFTTAHEECDSQVEHAINAFESVKRQLSNAFQLWTVGS